MPGARPLDPLMISDYCVPSLCSPVHILHFGLVIPDLPNIIEREGWVQILFTISLLADIPQLGATTILVTAPNL